MGIVSIGALLFARGVTLDSHQHFWRYDAAQYPWIQKGSPLHRDWLPADLAPLLAEAGVSGCIAVQARQNFEESRWLLSLARDAAIIKGVVGWVDLRGESVGRELAELARDPKFRGVRHVVQDEADPVFMQGREFQRGIGALHQFGLVYDILVTAQQIPSALKLAQAFPDLPFVLDHAGKPRIKAAVVEPWRFDVRELAKCANVFCKVSGLVTEADHAKWQPADLRRYLDVIFAAFGEDRVMFGSDWPVCLLAGEYPRVVNVVREYAAQFSAEAQAKLFGGNAARFYGITD